MVQLQNSPPLLPPPITFLNIHPLPPETTPMIKNKILLSLIYAAISINEPPLVQTLHKLSPLQNPRFEIPNPISPKLHHTKFNYHFITPIRNHTIFFSILITLSQNCRLNILPSETIRNNKQRNNLPTEKRKTAGSNAPLLGLPRYIHLT